MILNQDEKALTALLQAARELGSITSKIRCTTLSLDGSIQI